MEALQGYTFAGIELLTLSACHSGFGDSKNGAQGVEVESFAMLAQKKGAGAVLASLWAVWDGSTAALMTEFYRRRAVEPMPSKWEALLQAQEALLRGEVTREGSTAATSPEELSAAARAVAAPPFPHDSKARYAHPYYWAPFFLTGNGL